MNRIIFPALALLAVCLPVSAAFGDEETCASCDKKILVTGQFQHGRGHESLTIEGAPRRGEEAFREEIYGTNFSVTVPNLPAGRYTVIVGVAEVDFLNAGQRAFDITCGDQVVASNLDIFAAAGGAGRVLLLTNQIDFPGDALRGPLALNFTGRTGAAKLNTFELLDASRQSLVSLRAADLVSAEDAAALKIPAVTAPEIWRDCSQPTAARVRDLVSRLSLAEKVQQMRNGAAAILRLGIPAYDFWSECLHGVAREGNATVFPQAIGMAATWDAPLIHDEADVIATEARAKFNDFISQHDGSSTRRTSTSSATRVGDAARRHTAKTRFLPRGSAWHSSAACRATIPDTSRRWLARNILPSTAGRNRSGIALTLNPANAIFTKRICRNLKPPSAKAMSAR
jgi:beta-glucosidase